MYSHSATEHDTAPRPGVPQALALALGAAVSLGLARFSYALLLPPMRDDLGWSYFTAGAMNTANATGYLVGALLMPRWLARADARWVLLAGMLVAALLLAAHGLAHGEVMLLLLRAATGMASAGTFVAGGLMAARLGQALATDPAHRHRGALVLGLYYGGTGAGIVASTLLVPAAAQWASGVGAGGGVGLGWRAAWVALAVAALAATAARSSAAAATAALAAPVGPVGPAVTAAAARPSASAPATPVTAALAARVAPVEPEVSAERQAREVCSATGPAAPAAPAAPRAWAATAVPAAPALAESD